MKNKRIAVIILSSLLIICTVFTLLSVESIIDGILEIYRTLISAFPDGAEFQDLLTADTLKKCFFADIAILLISGLITLYYSVMDRILEKKTLLIACLVVAMLSVVDVVSLAVAIADFIVILTIDDGKKAKSQRHIAKKQPKKPTIKKLED